jgi:hypothetical protein
MAKSNGFRVTRVATRRFATLIASIAMFGLIRAHAEDAARVCIDITLDSAGVYGFSKAKIDGVARSHGLNGIADYVLILPPASSSDGADDIVKLIVMTDVRLVADPECEQSAGEARALVTCAQSIPGYQLKLLAKFASDRPSAQHRRRMAALMRYIVHDVLCDRSTEKI